MLDPDGGPLAGALVLIGPTPSWNVDLPDGRRAYTPRQPLLVTDAEGGFEHVGDLEAGPQEVHVCARGFGVWSGSVEVVQDVRAWLEVQLDEPVRITGRVVDADGAPVAGARVIASREVGAEYFRDPFAPVQATSDGRGLFALDWVAPGLQELSARVPEQDRLGRARASVECAAGEAREVELVLELGPTIRGRVVDAEGLPLAGWAVHGDASGWVEDRSTGRVTSLNLRRSDRTDGDGSFVLAGLTGLDAKSAAGVDLCVQAPEVWWGPPRAELRGVRAGTQDVELVVEDSEVRMAGLRGRVLEAGGGAPQDVRVTVWDESGSTGYFAEHDLASGAFEWSVPVPGVYSVVVMGGGSSLATRGPLTLVAGETARVEVEAVAGFPVGLCFDFAEPAARWATIEFEVRDEHDRVVRRGGPWPPARLKEGVLELHLLSLPAGRFTALARTDSGLAAFGSLAIEDLSSARGPHRFSLR